MCGIFAYTGSSADADEKTINGLRTLEYRGYDSWGVAYIRDGFQKIFVEKAVGKIGSSKLKHSAGHPKSFAAIGHTRWATHGNVSVKNAHPHLTTDKTTAVVHNGIIENFSNLKQKLQNEGLNFSTDTDTEVFVRLLEKERMRLPFDKAFIKAFSQVEGLNAFVALDSKSKTVMAAKTGSPIVVGKGKDGNFLASDATGILPYTNEVLFLEDNQCIKINDGFELIDTLSKKKLPLTFQKLTWSIKSGEKGSFDHYLLKEIFEQPAVISQILKNQQKDILQATKLIEQAFGTFMLGCGTASYAALVGTYFFSRVAKKHINFSIGSEFSYLEDYLTPQSLLIPISQSGETIDIVDPVSKAKKRGTKTLAITNTVGSTLYRMSDKNILLGAGPEIAVVGTKSYIAMISILLLLAYATGKKYEEGVRLLEKAEKNVEEILKPQFVKKIKLAASKIAKKEHIFTIGRGISYATALEAALKLKETSLIHAEGFAGGELKHGTISLIEKGTPCIVFAPNDETQNEILSNAQEIKTRGGLMIGVGPQESAIFDVWLPTKDCGDATLIPQTVIIQLLAYYLALKRGVEDPDKPRNLAKSVTVK